jgi:hypothetical protein
MMKAEKAILTTLIMAVLVPLYGQNGLIAHWSFDGIVENIILDNSVNVNHGINYGADIVPGIKGTALSFNGTGDYARIPADGAVPPLNLRDLGEGSISLWFKAYDIPVAYGIAPIFYYGAEAQCDFFDAANEGLIIELGHSPIHAGSEALYFTIWKNGCTYPSFCFDSGDGIERNKWYHVVIVVGGAYNTGFLNGEEMVNRDYNFGSRYDSQFFEDARAHEKLWIGKGHWDRTTQYFEGLIDEVMIFNRPLSAGEVTALYNDVGHASATAITSDRENSMVTVYPNPASEVLFFDIQDQDGKILDMALTDITGRTLQHESEISSNGSINIQQLGSGLYSIEFAGENFSVRKPVFIER